MQDLWNGVRFKLDMAHFYLDEMRKDLLSVSADLESSYYQSRQRVVSPANRWAPKFYYHLDAFLAATRSVDFVITTTFGIDSILGKNKWIATLPTLEQTNRKAFKLEYDLIAADFRGHLLTHIRNVSIHRSGTPLVEVAVLGRWGEHYRGGPTQSLPTYEQFQQQTTDDPDHPWMEPLKFAIAPGPDEFVVQKALPGANTCDHPLFPSCEDYLRSAGRLVEDAKSLAERVHTNNPLTLPPLYDI